MKTPKFRIFALKCQLLQSAARLGRPAAQPAKIVYIGALHVNNITGPLYRVQYGCLAQIF